MKDNNLSPNLWPGLVFCEPTTPEMIQAACAWAALIDRGLGPLPIGHSWGDGTVVPDGAIVFHRLAAENIQEGFHWREGRCTGHYFEVAVSNLRALINVEEDRENAFELALSTAHFVKGWYGFVDVGIEDDDDDDDQVEDEGGELTR